MPDKHEVGGSSPLGPTSTARCKDIARKCFRAADKPRVRSVTRAMAYQHRKVQGHSERDDLPSRGSGAANVH